MTVDFYDKNSIEFNEHWPFGKGEENTTLENLLYPIVAETLELSQFKWDINHRKWKHTKEALE